MVILRLIKGEVGGKGRAKGKEMKGCEERERSNGERVKEKGEREEWERGKRERVKHRERWKTRNAKGGRKNEKERCRGRSNVLSVKFWLLLFKGETIFWQ